MSMKKITMLINRILSLSLAAALALSSPIVAYAEGDNEAVVVENSVNDNSGEASSSETGRAEDESASSSKEDASGSDDATPANSDEAANSNDSAEEKINNGSDEDSSLTSDEDAELDEEDEDELKDEDKDKECKHEDEFEYESNGDGTHIKKCKECGEVIDETEECEFDEDGVCIHCGYKKEEEGQKSGIFEITIDDYTITVDVPEGAFEESVELKASKVELTEDELDLVDAEVEGTVVSHVTFDIHFEGEDGEIEPACAVTVNITSPSISADSEIVHIDDEGNAENIACDVVDGEAEFEADSFSTYTIAGKEINSNAILYKDSAYGTAYTTQEYSEVSKSVGKDKYGIRVKYAGANNPFAPIENGEYKDKYFVYSNLENDLLELHVIAPENYYIEAISLDPTNSSDMVGGWYRPTESYATKYDVTVPLKKGAKTTITLTLKKKVATITSEKTVLEGASLVNYVNYINGNKAIDSTFQFGGGGMDGSSNQCHYGQVYQGIASDTLVNNGTTFRLATGNNINLFPSSAYYGNSSYISEVDNNVGVEFKMDSDGYWTLDSSRYLYKYDSSDKTNGCNGVIKSQSGEGFWPFSNSKGGGDVHFGMMLPINFSVNESGTTTNANGDSCDTIFKFSGDDDVFVYIDGKLVLDIGGIHNAVSGQINFKTGEILLQGDGDGWTGSDDNKNSFYLTSSKDESVFFNSSDFKDNLYDIVDANNVSEFSQTNHDLVVVYFERGAHRSNCRISYNFVPNNTSYKKSISIEKTWEGAATDELVFDIYGTCDGKYLLLDGTTTTEETAYKTVTLKKPANWNGTDPWKTTVEGFPVFLNNDTSKIIQWTVVERPLEGYESSQGTTYYDPNTAVSVKTTSPEPVVGEAAYYGGSHAYKHIDIEYYGGLDTNSTDRKVSGIQDIYGNSNKITVVGHYNNVFDYYTTPNNYYWDTNINSYDIGGTGNGEYRANISVGDNTKLAFRVQFDNSGEYQLVVLSNTDTYPQGTYLVKNKYKWNDTSAAANWYRTTYKDLCTYYGVDSNSATLDLSGKNIFEVARAACPGFGTNYGQVYPCNNDTGLDFILTPRTIEENIVTYEHTGNETHYFTNKQIAGSLSFTKELEGTLNVPEGYNVCYEIKVEKVNADGSTTVISNTDATVTSTYNGLRVPTVGYSNGAFNIFAGQKVTLSGLTPGSYKITEVGAFMYDPNDNSKYQELDMAQFTTSYVGVDVQGVATVESSKETAVTVKNAVKTEYTWDLKKVSATTHNVLAGAEFELEIGDTKEYIFGKSDSTGTVIWYNSTYDRDNNLNPISVPDGTYILRETKAPKGYALSTEEWTVVVKKYEGITATNGTTTYATTSDDTTIVIEFENEVSYTLPETGGRGVYVYTIGGVLLMIGAALLLYKSKKNNKKQ